MRTTTLGAWGAPTGALGVYGFEDAAADQVVELDLRPPFTAAWVNPSRSATWTAPERTAAWTHPSRTATWTTE